MRVNVDDMALDDVRFPLVAQALGPGWCRDRVLGKCVRVWMYALKHRTTRLDGAVIDAIAECRGFAAAMAAARANGKALANETPEGFELAGMRDRIAWLVEQDRKSERGVEARKQARAKSSATSQSPNPRVDPRVNPEAQPGDNPPDTAPDLDQSPDPRARARGRGTDGPGVPERGGSRRGNGHADRRGPSTVDPAERERAAAMLGDVIAKVSGYGGPT